MDIIGPTLIVFILVLAGIGGYTVVVGDGNGLNYHQALCAERLKHASTSGDSLVIYTDDKWCLSHPKEENGKR